MTSNQNPEGISSGRIEATDDVEGHVIRGKIDGPDTDDVEGHKRAGGLVADEPTEDDTEGHGARIRF